MCNAGLDAVDGGGGTASAVQTAEPRAIVIRLASIVQLGGAGGHREGRGRKNGQTYRSLSPLIAAFAAVAGPTEAAVSVREQRLRVIVQLLRCWPVAEYASSC